MTYMQIEYDKFIILIKNLISSQLHNPLYSSKFKFITWFVTYIIQYDCTQQILKY